MLTAVAAQYLNLRHIQDRAAPSLSLLRSCPAAPGREPRRKPSYVISLRAPCALPHRRPTTSSETEPPPHMARIGRARRIRAPAAAAGGIHSASNFSAGGPSIAGASCSPRRHTARPDDDGTVLPCERLQRFPDLHRLTYLPTCSSTNPTPNGIPTAKSGSRIATERHRSDRSTALRR